MGQANATGRLAEGTIFGHYEIVRHLGSGGMGSVYEATHTKLSKQVALKTLLPHYAANPEAQTRFLREGKLAAKLRHPHVVDVTDFGIEDGVPYLVMEFLRGRDLAGHLADLGRLQPQQIADIMLPVTAALASAHDRQIVHRDLKPQNIFLAESSSGDPNPKVLDFGISKLLGDTEGGQLTGSMNLLGTPSFMSPEQARSSKNIDARSDQYTLAVILYQCVTGKLPFASEGIYELIRMVVEGEFRPPGEVVDDLSPDFETVVLKGMSNNPDDRFASTWDFGCALLPFASLRCRVLWEPELNSKATSFVGHLEARKGSRPEMRAVSPSPAQPSHPQISQQPTELRSPTPRLGRAPTAAPEGLAPKLRHASHPGHAAEGLAPSGTQDIAAGRGPEATDRGLGRGRRYAILGGLGIGGAALLGLWSIWGGPPSPPAAPPTLAVARIPAPSPPPPAPVRVAPPPPANPAAPATFHTEIQVTPADAEIELDGKRVGAGAFTAELPKDGHDHTLQLHRAGYEPRQMTFHDALTMVVELKALEPRPKHKTASTSAERPVAPVAVPAESGTGTLVVTAKLDGASVWADLKIDGAAAGRTPLTRKDLPSGTHHLELSRPDGSFAKVDAVVHRGQTTKVIQALSH